VPAWHPDVRVWEVSGAGGQEIGLFFGDYFARPSKRSGAWMTALRNQQNLAGKITPHIVNVCNFAKAAAGEPTLLSFDDACTLFHEFGHALHGLLSAVTYPMIAGTNVAADFVELPSQLYEHWLEQPQLLRRFAMHYQTGAPMPEELLQRIIAARNFNKGFATVEYIACAEVDLDLHSLAPPPSPAPPGAGPRGRGAARGGRPPPASACCMKSRCGTGSRILSIFSPAAVMRRAITAICGRKCSMPTPSRRSRRPAIFSIPPLRSVCAIAFTPLADGKNRRKPTRRFAGGCRPPMRCCASAALPHRPRR